MYLCQRSIRIKVSITENLEDYNPTKKRRVLIVSDDMIEDMESNKN